MTKRQDEEEDLKDPWLTSLAERGRDGKASALPLSSDAEELLQGGHHHHSQDQQQQQQDPFAPRLPTDPLSLRKMMLSCMKPGETILSALKRLDPGQEGVAGGGS